MRRYSSSKDINLLIRSLLAEGWSYQSGRSHGRIRPPEGRGFVSVPCTPSDYRAFDNFLHAVRRLVSTIHCVPDT